VSHDLDQLVLTRGTILIKDVGADKSGPFNNATCTFPLREKGNWTIIGGTGAYQNLKGHGSFTVSGAIQFAPDGHGGCTDNAVSGLATVVGTGQAKL
jgi:hypothetical protein